MREMRVAKSHKRIIAAALLVAAACFSVQPSMARKKKAKAASHVAVQEDTLPRNERQRYDYFFLEAARKQAAGKYTEAFDLLEHARRINPKAAEVYSYQSAYYLQMKQDSLALAMLQKAVALNPENQIFAEQLAQYYVTHQQYDQAAEAYERLFANNHDNTDALRILLQLYQQKKDYPMMLNVLGRLEVEEGESEQFALSKMRIYEMMNDDKAAYAELKALVDAHPIDLVYKTMLGNWLMQHERQKEAYKLFSDVLKEDPENAYAQSSLYDYYNAVGQEAEARQMLDKILLSKKTDAETKVLMIRSFIQDNERQGGDSTKVFSLFDKVLSQPQSTTDVAELRAAYLELKKMPQDSIDAAYQQVLDIAPDNAPARVQIVQSLWKKKDYDGIIAQSKMGEAYNPDYMLFYYFCGMAHYMKREEKSALDEFRRGIAQVNDESSPDLVSDLYMMMGDILHNRRKTAEAYAAYDSCLQWKPDNVSGLNNYAYYLSLEGGDLHKAEQMSYKAIKAEPNNGTFLDTYAWILFMEERYAEAKTYMDQTLKNIDSTEVSSAIYEHAGDIYSMNGLTDEAVRFWKKAYDMDDMSSDVLGWKVINKRYISKDAFNQMMVQRYHQKRPVSRTKARKTNHGKKKK